MDEVKINTSKTLTLTLPSDPTSNLVSVSLYHEFGDLVSGPTSATRTGTGVYTITYGQRSSGIYILNSAGKHRADFTYTISGVSCTQSQYINVYTPYLTASEFFDAYPDLEDAFANNFEAINKRVRNVINTFCGQTFDFYENLSISINGNGYASMRLPLPISNMTEVIQDPGTDDEFLVYGDTVENIEKVKQAFDFDSSWNIRFKKSNSPENIFILGKFNVDSVYKVTGNYGWRYVPDNITQAAQLLVADIMNNDSEYRNHGIYRADMDAISLYMNQNFYESTGNIEADILLMDYTLFVMDYVV
jgi:hypothetical protein